ncbi:hypothetical protein ACH4TE_24350 [Streptomyces sioyaensis]|uniref:hypothetical protein n=1 Tax=Streptomyces sioyaensis TaxID=67364 RepID=UPI0037A90E62
MEANSGGVRTSLLDCKPALFVLAGLPLPERPADGGPGPALQKLVEVLEPHPAYLPDPTWDLAGWNRAEACSPVCRRMPGRRPSCPRSSGARAGETGGVDETGEAGGAPDAAAGADAANPEVAEAADPEVAAAANSAAADAADPAAAAASTLTAPHA